MAAAGPGLHVQALGVGLRAQQRQPWSQALLFQEEPWGGGAAAGGLGTVCGVAVSERRLGQQGRARGRVPAQPLSGPDRLAPSGELLASNSSFPAPWPCPQESSSALSLWLWVRPAPQEAAWPVPPSSGPGSWVSSRPAVTSLGGGAARPTAPLAPGACGEDSDATHLPVRLPGRRPGY